jgi:hypothetical protein
MSRAPAHVVAGAGKPADRQALWEAMLGFADRPFTVTELHDATDMDRRTIASYLQCLIAGGYGDRTEGDSGAWAYRLTREALPRHAPRLNRAGQPVTQGAGVENMWRSMRMLAQFSPRDIAAYSCTDAVSVTEATARSYCSMLFRARFLRVVRKAVPGRSQAIYRLARNTGPQPPMIQRVRQVFDPNTGTVHPLEGRA